MPTTRNTPSGREIYEASLSGTYSRPYIPRLRSDKPIRPPPHTLSDFREGEGRENRKRRLQELWKRLPNRALGSPRREANADTPGLRDSDGLTPEKAESLKAMYDDELFGRCEEDTLEPGTGHIDWKKFKEYAEAKEVGEFPVC